MFDFKFRRQHPIGSYVVDFYCAELRLCVEIDGGVHGFYAQAIHDAERSRELSGLGLIIVRLRNDDVLAQPTATWEFLVWELVAIICKRTGCTEGDVLCSLVTKAAKRN